MNKGYKKYIADSFFVLKNIIYSKPSNFFKTYLFIIIQNLLSGIPILDSMIKLSNMSFTKNLCKYGKVSVSDSINDVLYSKNIITTIVFNLLKGLVTFIFLIPFILVFAAIVMLANSNEPNMKMLYTLLTFFGIAILVLIVGVIVVEALTFPAFYLLLNKDEISLKNTIKKSFNLAKEVIPTYLALYFVFGFGYFIYLVLYFTLIIFTFISFIPIFSLLFGFLVFVLTVLAIVLTPLIVFAFNGSIYMLIDDLDYSKNKSFEKSISVSEQNDIIKKYKEEVYKLFNEVDKNKTSFWAYNKLERKYKECVFLLDSLKNEFSLKRCELICDGFKKYEYKIMQKNRKKYIRLTKAKKNKLTKKIIISFSVLVTGGLLVYCIGSMPCVQYNTYGSYASVTGVKGLLFSDYFDIPIRVKDYVDGLPVTEIEKGAFASTKIKKITLPKTLKFIDSLAFENCVYLEEVNTYIDEKLHKNTINCVVINNAAFSGCISLKTINITKNVERIAYNTFVESPNVCIIYEGGLEEWIIVSGNIDYCEIIFEDEN